VKRKTKERPQESTEGAHAVPELGQDARAPVGGVVDVGQQCDDVCQREAWYEHPRDRDVQVSRRDADGTRTRLREEHAREDAKGDERAEDGER
jgi:hypothetical protein